MDITKDGGGAKENAKNLSVNKISGRWLCTLESHCLPSRVAKLQSSSALGSGAGLGEAVTGERDCFSDLTLLFRDLPQVLPTRMLTDPCF